MDDRILLTISYCHQFGYPLTKGEIWHRLVSEKAAHSIHPKNLTTKKKTISNTSFRAFEKALRELIKQKKVFEHDNFFGLKPLSKNVTLRQQRAEFSQKKWLEVSAAKEWLARIPWIEAIFITGSLAMNNCTKDDDVDFFIVTQPNRLWLTRVLVGLIAMLHGRRRSWHSAPPNSWCFNLWLDTEHLQLPPASRSLYHAYEVIQAKPIFDRHDTVDFFYKQNTWVHEWLSNWEVKKNVEARRIFSTNFFTKITNPVLNFTDWLLWQLQYAYMRRHLTRERVSRGVAFFHPRDTKTEILKKIKFRSDSN